MKKKHYLVLIGLIVIAILLKIRPNNKVPSLPKANDVESISLINIVDGRGIEKWTISEKDDIERFLQILEHSKKTNKESVSDFPNKNNFILVSFGMSDGGYIRNSIYEEDKSLYFEQAYVGIYELSYKDISSFLKSSVKEEDKETISKDLEDILKNNF
ncbi:MAG: DUF5301 domain-containing protein [Anaerococcus prevotii]|uniref:DUF5301 domain-containing protein n=1 Tax=Anaerococcus prevotii TaxID=33034 RepID=UPI0028FFAF12|nr:DUF5301 domain-containing protein [Anaerococcus prevotii]MDU2557664.1 DUF5301 domain-containing protein [Anaerococcus prevotii]